MDEEDERLDPEELGEIASSTFKKEIERRVVTDDDGFSEEITVETTKTMTPAGEIVKDKRVVVSKFMTCGHQVTDPRQIMRCVYDGHPVCRDCLLRCDGSGELVCLNHSDEYEFEGQILRLCQDCAAKYELHKQRENTITKRAFRMIKGMLRKEQV